MRSTVGFLAYLNAFAFAALLFAACMPQAAGQGNMIVDNDPPSFIGITVEETEYYNYVDVQVRDLNGWNDIFAINVTITGNAGDVLSQVCYMVYPSLTSTSVATIDWNQTEGGHFVEAESAWAPVPVPPWNPDNAVMEIGLRVIFAFEKFSGETVNITAMDKGQLTCWSEARFSAEYTPAPEWENVAIPIGLSTVVAAGVAGFMVYRRFKNNKLARAVEASQAGPGK